MGQDTIISVFNTNDSDKPSIFYLAQGYDSAWIALQIPENQWHFKQYKLLTHLRYNGWANSWAVPAGRHQILIVYWPQLLSFAGFGLLGLTGAIFILTGLFKYLRKHKA